MSGFREILLNSINHKQYEESNPVQISIYEDKIYVWNDGKFPEELASQNLFNKHYSKPYNPLIAQTFFKAGFIESWGRGFEKIKIECKNVQINVHKNVQINGHEKLNKIEKLILEIISEDPEITQVNIATALNTTPKTIQRGMSSLKEKGIIERIGSNKKGYWKVIN